MSGIRIEFVNKENEKVSFSVDGLIKERCNKSICGKYLFLTPKYLDMVRSDQIMVDFYGNKKKKSEFEKERKGELFPSYQGGATIYAIEVV